MGPGNVATWLKQVQNFVDFIPDPVKTPVSALLKISISICERIEQVSENVQAVADLAEQQAGISADVVHELRGVTKAQIDSGDWVQRLEKLTKALEEVRDWVVKESANVEGDRNSTKAQKARKALAKLWNSPEKKEEINTLKVELDKTRERLKLQLGIATLVGVQRIREIVQALLEFHDKMLVDRLKPVFGARYGAYGSPGDCLRDTRLTLRVDLLNCLTANDGQRIIWLYGLAGMGKSTVARSICSDLKDTHDVVSFFIKRGEHSNQKQILHTLVYQLGRCIPQVFSAIVRAKDEVFEAHIHNQVNGLVITPLSTVLPGARPVVIIVDAVDERDGTKNECDIIPCFLDAIATAQVPVRVLVTSRGQPSDFLRPRYRPVHDTQYLQQTVVRAISIHDESYDPTDDIRAYLVTEFERVAMERSLCDWPFPEQITHLVRMSARLFIYAATIIRWVDCSAPDFALGRLLEQSSALMERTGPETIFALYEYIIGHALDENTPQQLLRSALGKKLDDRTKADALCRGATLSILSTLRCLREPLTYTVFVQLWAGHLIAKPTLCQGAVAIAKDLISRLSGVLFVWEPDSSMTLLHASFSDFLDAPSSPYHISSEATHCELASKCLSIMISTKAAYLQFGGASLEYPLLDHRLDVIRWIPGPELVARYSFAQWIHHACRAPRTQLPPLVEDVRLAERGFWFAGLFLHPADINVDSLKQATEAMRAHPQGVEAAYALATVVYMCTDEASDFMVDDSRSLGLNSFNMTLDALSTLDPLSDSTRSDCLDVEHRINILRSILYITDLWLWAWPDVKDPTSSSLSSQLGTTFNGRWEFLRVAISGISNHVSELTNQFQTDKSTGKWPPNFSTSIYNIAAVLGRFQEHLKRRKQEMETLKSIAEELQKQAVEFRYAIREFKQHIIKPYDELFIVALDRRNASLTNSPAHKGDGP